MILVGIPAFNEESSIAKVVIAAKRHCDEVLVIDDGSVDSTKEIVESLGAKVIKHETNRGYGEAIASIFRYAATSGCDFLVTLDGDGQHDPGTIAQIIEPLQKDKADLVIGSRFLEEEEDKTPMLRKLGIRFITQISGAAVSDTQSGFRAYNKRALSLIKPLELGMSASIEILSQATDAGLRIFEVPISVVYDEESHTHSTVYHGLDVITGTIRQLSLRHPLMLYGIPGALFLSIGLGFGAWTLYLWPIKGYIVTNLALVSIGSGGLGLQLLLEGIRLSVLLTVIRSR